MIGALQFLKEQENVSNSNEGSLHRKVDSLTTNINIPDWPNFLDLWLNSSLIGRIGYCSTQQTLHLRLPYYVLYEEAQSYVEPPINNIIRALIINYWTPSPCQLFGRACISYLLIFMVVLQGSY